MSYMLGNKYYNHTDILNNKCLKHKPMKSNSFKVSGATFHLCFCHYSKKNMPQGISTV